jgi:hypothetical protein
LIFDSNLLQLNSQSVFVFDLSCESLCLSLLIFVLNVHFIISSEEIPCKKKGIDHVLFSSCPWPPLVSAKRQENVFRWKELNKKGSYFHSKNFFQFLKQTYLAYFIIQQRCKQHKAIFFLCDDFFHFLGRERVISTLKAFYIYECSILRCEHTKRVIHDMAWQYVYLLQ